ncbi:hypothetical protein KKE34_05225 [Patescibacteria group bacterium]|nr:hypothetical protein [Patescibacteria group bacterium]MBU1885977.1 hypothetical protein [Patescibacteria group bacterium]
MSIEDYLIKLCKHVGLTQEQFSIEVDELDKAGEVEEGDKSDKADKIMNAKITLPEEESGMFIGFHGETLRAIQRIIRVSFYSQLENKLFKLNINDYLEQYEEQLRERVVGIARRVLETGEIYTFSYLPSSDRFLVHTILSSQEELGDLVSESVGEGRGRYLTIRLKNQDEPA